MLKGIQVGELYHKVTDEEVAPKKIACSSCLSSTVCAVGLATIVIAAMACSAAISPTLMGGMTIGLSGAGLIASVVAAKNLEGQGKSAAKAAAVASAVFMMIGALTVTGIIPVAAMGWTAVGLSLAFICSLSSSSSVGASFGTGVVIDNAEKFGF